MFLRSVLGLSPSQRFDSWKTSAHRNSLTGKIRRDELRVAKRVMPTW